MRAGSGAPDYDGALRSVGAEWSAEVLSIYRSYERARSGNRHDNIDLRALVQVLDLFPQLHNLAVMALRRLCSVAIHGSCERLHDLDEEETIQVSPEAVVRLDLYMGRDNTHYFVLRHMLSRKLEPVERHARGILVALGHPADAARCGDCIARARLLLAETGFTRVKAAKALAAMRQLAREIEDSLRFLGLEMDDRQPPLAEVRAGSLPPEALYLWLRRERADMLQLEAIDFYEDAARPAQPSAGHERTLERLRRKVEQSIRVIDRLRPTREVTVLELHVRAGWTEDMRSLRRAATPGARKHAFRHAITRLGTMVRIALDAADEAAPAAAAALAPTEPESEPLADPPPVEEVPPPGCAPARVPTPPSAQALTRCVHLARQACGSTCRRCKRRWHASTTTSPPRRRPTPARCWSRCCRISTSSAATAAA